VSKLATWSTLDAAVATVAIVGDAPPTLTAVGDGTTMVRGEWSGLSATGSVTVSSPVQADARTLKFEDLSCDLPVGGRKSPRFSATDAYGAQLDGSVATITSSDSDVVTVSSTADEYGWLGVTGVKLGTAIVSVSLGGKTASLVVTVSHDADGMYVDPIWDDLPLHVHQRTALWAHEGRTYAEMTEGATWTSSAPGVVRVVRPGIVEAVAPGFAFVTAASGLASETLPVPVSSAGVVALDVQGWAPLMPVGATYGFGLTARYADGFALGVREVATWVSADPTIADFDPAEPGLLVAKTAGIVRVEARLDGVVGTAEVTVF
jgi:hypothetical protein